MKGVRLALMLAASLAGLACAKSEDVIIHTGAGSGKSSVDIDRDALSLLPGGAISVGVLDAKALFASEFGARLLELSRKRMPVPEAAGFEPQRDLAKVYYGVYSMQGADVAGVALGNFDVQKIEAAADGVQRTPQGVPVTRSKYAGRTVYTADAMGFTVLTAHTALFGNTTGIRRALDRISEGKAARELPEWASKVLGQVGVPFAFGSNLKENPVPNAIRSKLTFLESVETIAVVGNFAPPGLNLAGTMRYPDEATAKLGAARVLETRSLLDTYAPFLSLLGIPQPVRKLESEASGVEARFVAGIDGQGLGVLLARADDLLPKPKAQP